MLIYCFLTYEVYFGMNCPPMYFKLESECSTDTKVTTLYIIMGCCTDTVFCESTPKSSAVHEIYSLRGISGNCPFKGLPPDAGKVAHLILKPPQRR